MNPSLGLAFNIIGLIAGISVYLFESRRRNVQSGFMTEVMLVGIASGAVFATLTERLVERTELAQFFSYTAGGRTVIGGVIGGWAMVELYKWRFHVGQSSGPMWALAMPAGEFLGRIGCWFNGCCYGRKTDMPWGMLQHGAFRHPTQI